MDLTNTALQERSQTPALHTPGVCSYQAPKPDSGERIGKDMMGASGMAVLVLEASYLVLVSWMSSASEIHGANHVRFVCFSACL